MTQDGRSPLGPFALWALCIVVGIVAGLGAVAFRALIALFHNLLFLGKFSAAYDANVHTPPSPWGPFVILVPVVGAAGVTFLVKTFAPEAKGHGVPEVMDAVYHRRGIIRPVVSVVKALASALSIGSGGSVGREGPIIQIGSSFGSTLGQWLKLPVWQLVTLIAAGTGGGIGATFNTPAGGMLFAVEIVLLEVSARTLVPVMTATAVATYVGQVFFGVRPSFFVPALAAPSFAWTTAELIAYAGLGVVAGLISTLFIWSIYTSEEFFDKRVKGGYYVQHITGMLLVGVLMYALLRGWGHYYVQGVGYAAIQDALGGPGLPLGLLMILFGAKLLATSLTLGSGGSGGVFSPTLFLGTMAGGAWGDALNRLFPTLHVSPVAFAIAGMGGVVGGATGAALAAIVMIFEMTRDADAILPLVLTVAISYGVRRMLTRDSIYTRKLTLRGESVPQSMRADLTFSRRAEEVMRPLDTEAALAWTGGDGGPSGHIFVRADVSLGEVIQRMHAAGAPVALVTQDGAGVKGTITREDIVGSLAADVESFGD